jgi:hypothetical protein
MEPETAEAAPAATTAPKKHLTPQEWEQIVILWESGTVTQQDLSDRFGISKPAISEGLNRRGASKGRRSKEFAKVTEDALKGEALRIAQEIGDFKKKYHTYGDFIMQSAIIELQALRAKPRAERTKEENARVFSAIKYTAEVYANVRDNKFHLYDLYNDNDQEGELPDIGVTEYSAEELEAIQNKTEITLMDESDPLVENAIEELSKMEDVEAK